jgi:CRP-like cAMP-binding protein
MHESTVFPTEGLDTSPAKPRLERVLLCLVDGGPERQAIEAGEIDAVIDYADRKVILFPAAERALRSTSKPASTREPHANRILAALPSPEYRRLQHALEPVMLTEKQVLYEPGEPIRYVYFPLDSVISLLATVGSRRVLEVGLVGFEGMIGIPITLGVDVPSVRAMVHVPGAAMRVPEAQFREAYEKNRTLRHELTSYVYAELAMARQIAACSAFHTIEQRLARRSRTIGPILSYARVRCLRAWRPTGVDYRGSRPSPETRADSLPPWEHADIEHERSSIRLLRLLYANQALERPHSVGSQIDVGRWMTSLIVLLSTHAPGSTNYRKN